MEEIINNIVNEDTVKAAVEATEAIPVKAINWRKVGKVGGVVGAIVVTGAGIYAGIRYRRDKKLKAAKEKAAATGIDNVQVAKDDFEEIDSAEE